MKLVSLIMLGLVGAYSEVDSMENVVVENVEKMESAGLKERTFRLVKKNKNKVAVGAGGVVLAGAAAYLGVWYWKFRVARGRLAGLRNKNDDIWDNFDRVYDKKEMEDINERHVRKLLTIINRQTEFFEKICLCRISLKESMDDKYDLYYVERLGKEKIMKMIDYLGMDCFIKYDLDTSDVK